MAPGKSQGHRKPGYQRYHWPEIQSGLGLAPGLIFAEKVPPALTTKTTSLIEITVPTGAWPLTSTGESLRVAPSTGASIRTVREPLVSTRPEPLEMGLVAVTAMAVGLTVGTAVLAGGVRLITGLTWVGTSVAGKRLADSAADGTALACGGGSISTPPQAVSSRPAKIQV